MAAEKIGIEASSSVSSSEFCEEVKSAIIHEEKDLEDEKCDMDEFV